MICEKCGKTVEPVRIGEKWVMTCCGKTVEHPWLDRVAWLWLETKGD
jgi:hypothetical protein